MKILGISAYYHDSAVCLLDDGKVIYAAQEERFSRIKNDSSFPKAALNSCLAYCQVSLSDIDGVIFYDKPFLKFERIIETTLKLAPKGFENFKSAMMLCSREKLFLKQTLRKELRNVASKSTELPPLFFCQHHMSHAASAFYVSPFKKAMILCVDGVGEWATTSIWLGDGNTIVPIKEIHFPHSIGLLYSTFTSYCGFEVNSGEYKLMGLAPYGEPEYVDLILENLVDLKADGSFSLNMNFFDYETHQRMFGVSLEKLFNRKSRHKDGEIDAFFMNIAASIQKVIEIILVRMTTKMREDYNVDNLCMAGGVALNGLANEEIRKKSGFQKVWIQPASGDAGGALGAALSLYHDYFQGPRTDFLQDGMQGGFLGLSFADNDIQKLIEDYGLVAQKKDSEELKEIMSDFLRDEKIIGLFQGRMEFGPRALGSRSILADATPLDAQKKLNQKIKFRESFRPFAPIILEKRVADFFDGPKDSPYMLFISKWKEQKTIFSPKIDQANWQERLAQKRSAYPAVTHLNYTARYQSVNYSKHPFLYGLLEKYEEKTGHPILVNTSFNVKDEPIVCSPMDAIDCFMKTDIDVLVLENFILKKNDQNHTGYWNLRKKDQHQSLSDRPSQKELRLFFVSLSFSLAVFAGFFIPLLIFSKISVLVLSLSLSILLMGLIFPGLGKPFIKKWESFIKVTSKVYAFIFLIILFYGIFFPFSLFWRLFFQTRRGQVEKESYWIKPEIRDAQTHMKELY